MPVTAHITSVNPIRKELSALVQLLRAELEKQDSGHSIFFYFNEDESVILKKRL